MTDYFQILIIRISFISNMIQEALAKGLHNFALDFIDGEEGYTLKLQYSYNDSTPLAIPGSWLKH